MALNLNINFDSVMKLPLSRKVLILVVLNLVIVGLGWWLLLAPKWTEVKDLKTEFAELNKKLEENRVIAADIPKFRKEKEELEKKLKQAVAQLPNEKEIPDLIDAISEARETAGLKVLLFRPGREVPKGFYAEVPINMSVEGRYESLYDFSVRVANLPRIVNISKLEVTSAGHRGGLPVLNAKFVATTFRFVSADEQKKKPGRKKKK